MQRSVHAAVLCLVFIVQAFAFQDDAARPSKAQGMTITLPSSDVRAVWTPADASGITVAIEGEKTPLVFDESASALPDRVEFRAIVSWRNPDLPNAPIVGLPVRFTMTAAHRAIVGAHPGILVDRHETVTATIAFTAEVPPGSGRWIALDDVRQTRERGGRVYSSFTGALVATEAVVEERSTSVASPTMILDADHGTLTIADAAPFARGVLVVAAPEAIGNVAPFEFLPMLAEAGVVVAEVTTDCAGRWITGVRGDLFVTVPEAKDALGLVVGCVPDVIAPSRDRALTNVLYIAAR